MGNAGTMDRLAHVRDRLDRMVSGLGIYAPAQLAGSSYNLTHVVLTGYAYPPASVPFYALVASYPIGLAAWLTLNLGLLLAALWAIITARGRAIGRCSSHWSWLQWPTTAPSLTGSYPPTSTWDSPGSSAGLRSARHPGQQEPWRRGGADQGLPGGRGARHPARQAPGGDNRRWSCRRAVPAHPSDRGTRSMARFRGSGMERRSRLLPGEPVDRVRAGTDNRDLCRHRGGISRGRSGRVGSPRRPGHVLDGRARLHRDHGAGHDSASQLLDRRVGPAVSRTGEVPVAPATPRGPNFTSDAMTAVPGCQRET